MTADSVLIICKWNPLFISISIFTCIIYDKGLQALTQFSYISGNFCCYWNLVKFLMHQDFLLMKKTIALMLRLVF